MKEDRLSQLPDHLICEILNHLPTKESVKTSVLSTRWRNLWLWVPNLELNDLYFSDFDAFVSFGDRVFDSNRVACLQKIDLTINGNKNCIVDDVSYLTAWMDAAAKRKIQHLDINWLQHCGFSWCEKLRLHTKHLRLNKCETLVDLKLDKVFIDDAKFLSFPCLKTMHLRYVTYSSKAALEKLVSRCLVLEELDISDRYDEIEKGLQVHSQSLKRLALFRLYSSRYEPVLEALVIDAPLLCYLKIHAFKAESVLVNKLESNAKLNISLPLGFGDFDEWMRSSIRKLFSGILRVGDMTIFDDTFERIIQYSKVEPLPQFGFMFRLHVNINACDLKCLPTFLESCPNLKSLKLIWHAIYEELSEMRLSSVPKCLQSSLEFINVRVPFTACAAEMKIVRYFLENSAILKKFTLYLPKASWTQMYILEDLPKIPRGSTKCEVDIDVW